MTNITIPLHGERARMLAALTGASTTPVTPAKPMTTAQLQDRIREMAAKSIASRRAWLATGRKK